MFAIAVRLCISLGGEVLDLIFTTTFIFRGMRNFKTIPPRTLSNNSP